MQENAKIKKNLRSKGRIKDPKRGKYLNKFHSKNNGTKTELI